ncbi:type I restriction-modification system subunit M [Caldilinea aerophila]|uniref:site-specific DNA-methyltransferase (adenine-specific) n=1 Tax=Caldilinea aerophila (strain DSM 14535 / JCM 11387 / NBRC 104270 / STL-6-O1) TaxID=926550 RepID=I0I478_CALAS|nr:type I restriction-modification system subunit M [Caldilinea aerophila]BAM00066.1 type I restriction-modification system modification subunit [Caldilinea aerophila DSM 14535 = NBRC 104270]
MLDIPTLETWLWEAACAIRGPVDAPKFKDYILPLVFLKRLSDVFDDEIARLSTEYSSRDLVLHLLEQERQSGQVHLVRFYLPENARWQAIRQHGVSGLGQFLTDAVRDIARENPSLQGVINMVDFNATAAGQRIIPDDHLSKLIDVLSRHRLGLQDVEPDILGRAYEYLLRKFAEGQGQSAGEFYTPGEVAILMAHLLDPQPGMTVYDPTCGSGGLLIKCHLRLVEKFTTEKFTTENTESTENLEKPSVSSVPSVVKKNTTLPPRVAPLRLFGQEINPTTFAMARMNVIIHDMQADIRIGDTMRHPAFVDAAGRLQTFDRVTANPMWNQKFPVEIYENDPYERFKLGAPPSSSADWGWLQHMLASLNERGKMAVVLDTGAVSRGSGNQGSNRERDIRKAFVERDLIEAVILLPENLFYNTTAPGIILVVNRRKARRGEILLINASQQFAKGRPKNYLTEEHITRIADVYHQWRVGANNHSPLHTIITTDEAARNDYNLSPSRYVSTNSKEEVLPLEEAVVRLQEAEEERAEADRELSQILQKLGLWR